MHAEFWRVLAYKTFPLNNAIKGERYKVEFFSIKEAWIGMSKIMRKKSGEKTADY